MACRTQPREIARPLALARPLPDLSTLAERCREDRTGQDAIEAFHDLLALREKGGQNAVPVLGRILAGQANPRRIHGYAAAQALFYIGGSEAHRLLAKHFLSSQYSAVYGVRLAHHWEMEAHRRDEFIRRYHLVNLSTDLRAQLAAQTDARGRLAGFTVRLTNDSAETLRIPDLKEEQSLPLFVKSGGRGYLRGVDIPLVESEKWRRPAPVSLAPGTSVDIGLSAKVTRDTRTPWWRVGMLPRTRIVLTTHTAEYPVACGEDLLVSTLLEVTARDARDAQQRDAAPLWVGRVVSNAVTVRVPAP